MDKYQLVIVNASMFNTNTLEIEKNRSIFIQNGLVTGIAATKSEDYELENVLDANQRLLTPSFIDVHNHLNFVFGDTLVITNPEDFLKARKQLTNSYLPYGVIVVRSAGGREAHIPMEQSWMANNPQYVDYYPTGGALVSLDTKFYNHVYVRDSAEVASKINDYHNLGIRHIKIYSLMDQEQADIAIRTAKELKMNVFGHIENSLISITEASELGLANFEHAKTIFLEAIRNYESSGRDLSILPPDDNENWRYREYEVFNFLGTKDSSMNALINHFKENNLSLTPTLHIYAHPLGLTNPNIQSLIHQDDQLHWNSEKQNRAKKGYKVLASLVYKMYTNGIVLNTGSDTYDPGESILSEMLLLNDLGIPMGDVIKIASLNSAKSMNMSDNYGSIELGKKAHFILFEKSPMENPTNLLSKKTIIKDGVVWSEE